MNICYKEIYKECINSLRDGHDLRLLKEMDIEILRGLENHLNNITSRKTKKIRSYILDTISEIIKTRNSRAKISSMNLKEEERKRIILVDENISYKEIMSNIDKLNYNDLVIYVKSTEIPYMFNRFLERKNYICKIETEVVKALPQSVDFYFFNLIGKIQISEPNAVIYTISKDNHFKNYAIINNIVNVTTMKEIFSIEERRIIKYKEFENKEKNMDFSLNKAAAL